jgi:hypothetical protein
VARKTQTNTSKSAKILYRPVGIVSSLVAGLIAGQVVNLVWKHATPGEQEDVPQPLQSEYPMRQILAAAVVQGAIFAVVRALVDRGGARAFERWTGEWPGD